MQTACRSLAVRLVPAMQSVARAQTSLPLPDHGQPGSYHRIGLVPINALVLTGLANCRVSVTVG